jgi:putative aminopeptidase FrvX
MSTLAHPALEIFRRLLAVPAPSGREQAMAATIGAELDALGVAYERDPAGNVLVRVPGKQAAPLVCLAAHMDEIGMVVTRIEADGALRVDRAGGLFPWKLGEGPVEIFGDGEPAIGLLSMGSTHTPGAGDQAVTWTTVRVLTGLPDSELARRGIRPGSPVLPARSRVGPILLGPADDPLVAAWTFDDRMGMVALLRLLGELTRNGRQSICPLLIAFTVQEEVGGHGAKLVAQREQPEVFIAVDGCPMPPGAPLALDGRPGIWSKDRLVQYDHGLLVALAAAAQAASTELQPVVYDAAASDASLVFAAGAAPRVACLGHVRDNSHGYEIARLSVFDHLLDTLVQFVTSGEAGW